MSDIDEFHWRQEKGDADVLLSCGDVSDQAIIEAAQVYGCSIIFAVKGNHDTKVVFAEPIIDLHLRHHIYRGLSFGGLNGAWRYKAQGLFLYSQEEVQALLVDFPPVDVFLAHNSPRRIHDREDEVHYGFEGLNAYIKRAEPKILIHGHQHITRESRLEDTRIIGVYGHQLIEI